MIVVNDIYLPLTFGKYEGRSLFEIWRGSFKLPEKSVLSEYVKDLIDFLLGNWDKDRLLYKNQYILTNDDIDFLYATREKFDLKSDVIVNSDKIIVAIEQTDLRNKMIEFLLRYFNYSHFSEPHFNCWVEEGFEKEYSFVDLSKGSKLIAKMTPDPNYVKWLYTDSESVLIDDDLFQKLQKIPSIYPRISLYPESSIFDNNFSVSLIFKYCSHIWFHLK